MTTHESHSRSVTIMTETIPISLILLSSSVDNPISFAFGVSLLPMSSCL
jgi:hypothetical protein